METSGQVGERIGSYALVRMVGRGGMGEVWIAENVMIQSQVAIKLVIGEANDPDATARFLREARATAKIRHPGVVSVTDYGTRAAGGSYLVMELLEGRTLAELIERGPLAETMVVDLGIQIAEALSAAHDAGVVHRDLKPGNIFLANDPVSASKMRVKLLDFGIAKSIAASDVGVHTASGLLVGTPVYMAPEQCAPSRGAIDARTDLYALGVVLFEAVSGRPPFRGPTLGDLIDQHLNQLPPSLRRSMPHVSAGLETLISTLLAKQPADRPPSAAAAADALRRLATPRDASVLESTMPALAASAAESREPSTSSEPAYEATMPSMVPPSTPMVSALTVRTLDGTAGKPANAVSLRPPARVWRIPMRAFGLAVVALAIVGAVAWRMRSKPAVESDVSRLDPTQRAAACDRGNARACAGAAIDELNGATKPNLTRVFSRALSACDAAVASGCVTAASMYLDGSGVRADYVRSRSLAAKACSLNSGEGCDLEGQQWLEGVGGELDAAKAAQLFVRGCDLGDPGACRNVHRATRFGIGVERDSKRADEIQARVVELASRGCERGDGRSCLVQAEFTADDPGRAAILMSRACDLRSAAACGELAARLMAGVGVAKDLASARSLISEGCDRGQPKLCDLMVADLLTGATGTADPERARTLATRICNEYGDRSCTTLGVMYEAGLGVPKDLRLAALYLGRACNAGVMEACSQAAGGASATDPAISAAQLDRACKSGVAVGCYFRGLRAKQENRVDAARQDFERACGLSGDQYGCTELGELLIDGIGGAADPREGQRVVSVACESGAGPLRGGACNALATRLRDGRGVTRDVAESVRLFDLACTAGVPRACKAAAELLGKPALGLTPDPARVKALLARQCELDPTTCAPPP